MLPVGSGVEGGVAVAVARLQVGPGSDEQADDGQLALFHRADEGGALPGARVHVHPQRQVRRDDVNKAVLGGVQKEFRAFRIEAGRVAIGEQGLFKHQKNLSGYGKFHTKIARLFSKFLKYSIQSDVF